jgi:hypothetical protein
MDRTLKKQSEHRKNPHVVVLGQLGGQVRGKAKKRVNKLNGRKSGLARNRRKTLAVRRNVRQRRPASVTVAAGQQTSGIEGDLLR